MAPDLNSVPVPTSPRDATAAQPSPSLGRTSSTQQAASRQSSRPTSRRASQIYPMSPPPLPLASPGGHISASAQHAHPFPPLSPGLGGHVSSADAAGLPMRHPRPLTAAELHLELEKEQEAVVNRLTRELSVLRAHSASVASTASSATSAAVLDADHHGSTHPISARRHRSSSSVSRGSISAPYNGPTTFSTGVPLTSATAGIPHSHRYSSSSQQTPGDPSSAQQARSLSRSASVVSTPRYEEVTHYKQELEEAKRENEALKSRIRELERAIKKDGDGLRGRRGAPPTPVNGASSEGAVGVTPSEESTPQ